MKNYDLLYKTEKDARLIRHTDSDWGGCIDERKGTSGYVLQLGSKAIAWSSKKQATTELSSAEAEYIAVTSAACEAVCLRRILDDLQQDNKEPTTLFCDNMSTIAMTRNPIFHNRTKQIEIRHHFIRELVDKKEITLQFYRTDEQLADIFTKAISSEKFIYFSQELGVQGYF